MRLDVDNNVFIINDLFVSFFFFLMLSVDIISCVYYGSLRYSCNFVDRVLALKIWEENALNRKI